MKMFWLDSQEVFFMTRKSLVIAVAAVILLAPMFALALPKGLEWGMSPEQAQKILGAPSKQMQVNKYYQDAYYDNVEYAGLTLRFHLAFKIPSGLDYLDANDGHAKGADCADLAACRDQFEKYLAQVAADVPGIGTQYQEGPGDKLGKILMKTTGKAARIRYVVQLAITEKDVGHFGLILQQMRE
jgi:hypothetical protein